MTQTAETLPARKTRIRRPSTSREIRRNLRRRKLRAFLTLSGIALGAFSLTVMGSLAENFNHSISSLRDFLTRQVLVRPSGSSLFDSTGHLAADLEDDYEAVEGVRVVVPRVTVFFDRDAQQDFGPPRQIFGVDIAKAIGSPFDELELASGRRLEPGDRWKIVIGANLAVDNEVDGRPARPGDSLTIRGHAFEVVGVSQATGTPVDDFSSASISDTRVIAAEDDPFLEVDKIVDEFSVYVEEGADPNEVAARLEGVHPTALVFPPDQSERQIRQFSAIFSAIILGSALVALIVGGVAIINTMVFSVTERTREIGIKKAIGASARDVLREFLGEAVMLSMAGGILGGLGGYLFTSLLNAASRDRGVFAFLVTPRLLLFVFVLSVVIGAGAGFFPARRAARIDPVRALRTVG